MFINIPLREATKRKKEEQSFKRIGPKDTSKVGIKYIKNCNKQKITSYDGEDHMFSENNPFEEARKMWVLGKQLGLYADNKDKMITTLVNKKELKSKETH